ncbi:MAG: hypothetical protein WCB80_29840 [Mycobacterium sp.]
MGKAGSSGPNGTQANWSSGPVATVLDWVDPEDVVDVLACAPVLGDVVLPVDGGCVAPPHALPVSPTAIRATAATR